MSIDDQRWRAVEVCDVNAEGTIVNGRDSDGIYPFLSCRHLGRLARKPDLHP